MEISQFAAILNKFPDPVLILSRQQRVILANRAAETLLEAGSETGSDTGLAGRHLLSLIRQPDVLDCVQKVLTDTAVCEAEYVARQAVDITYRVVAQPLEAAETGLSGALLSFVDITLVGQADRIRSEFVANVSHELRSPLTALSGFIETMQGTAANDPAARASFLDIMATEADRMKRLIDDLLSLSRVEADERLRPTEPVNLVQLLRSVLQTLTPAAEKGGVVLDLDTASAEHSLPGDADQLIQVFQNLVENAIKYGGAGTVSIHLSTVERMAGIRGSCLRIDVRDQGPGITATHLPRLTERFYRVDDHRSRALGGTGLGLAIVKHIINRHRGRLLIDSTPGQGSVFSVILPVT